MQPAAQTSTAAEYRVKYEQMSSGARYHLPRTNQAGCQGAGRGARAAQAHLVAT